MNEKLKWFNSFMVMAIYGLAVAAIHHSHITTKEHTSEINKEVEASLSASYFDFTSENRVLSPELHLSSLKTKTFTKFWSVQTIKAQLNCFRFFRSFYSFDYSILKNRKNNLIFPFHNFW